MSDNLDAFIDEQTIDLGPMMIAFGATLKRCLNGAELQKWTADFSLSHGAATTLGCLLVSNDWRQTVKTQRRAVPRAMMELERSGALTKFRHMRQAEEGR